MEEQIEKVLALAATTGKLYVSTDVLDDLKRRVSAFETCESEQFTLGSIEVIHCPHLPSMTMMATDPKGFDPCFPFSRPLSAGLWPTF